VEDPFRIDEASSPKPSKSSSSWLPPLEDNADEAQAPPPQPVRSPRTLQRDLPTLQEAVRTEPGDDNSSLRDRFSIQGRSSKGKTRLAVGSDNASKRNEAPSNINSNEWLPDDPEPLLDTASGLATPPALLTAGWVPVPSVLHGTGTAADASSGQIGSAARRHPSVLIQATIPEPADELPSSEPEEFQTLAEREPKRAQKTPKPASTKNWFFGLTKPFWVWLIAGLVVLLISTLVLIFWLGGSTSQTLKEEQLEPDISNEPSKPESTSTPAKPSTR
jgi:hypothetical protein